MLDDSDLTVMEITGADAYFRSLRIQATEASSAPPKRTDLQQIRESLFPCELLTKATQAAVSCSSRAMKEVNQAPRNPEPSAHTGDTGKLVVAKQYLPVASGALLSRRKSIRMFERRNNEIAKSRIRLMGMMLLFACKSSAQR